MLIYICFGQNKIWKNKLSKWYSEIDEHLMGKQHAGYARIRSYVEEWKKVGNIK
jgi:hypothetical protein